MGKVYLVGAGPGDPDLLTMKAHRLLRKADVVLHDRLVSREVLALVPAAAERVCVGKHEGEQEEVQGRILDLLLHHGRRGGVVVRLKGGDPLVFGRGAEEMLFLRQHGVEAELVPGVSSAVAVPGLAGVPLTFRGVAQSFAVVTGHCREGMEQEWARYAGVDTLVVLMGVRHRAEIAQALLAAGRPPREPVAFVERGTTAQERIIEATLQDVADGGVRVASPAVWVLGRVVQVRKDLTRIDPVGST